MPTYSVNSSVFKDWWIYCHLNNHQTWLQERNLKKISLAAKNPHFKFGQHFFVSREGFLKRVEFIHTMPGSAMRKVDHYHYNHKNQLVRIEKESRSISGDDFTMHTTLEYEKGRLTKIAHWKTADTLTVEYAFFFEESPIPVGYAKRLESQAESEEYWIKSTGNGREITVGADLDIHSQYVLNENAELKFAFQRSSQFTEEFVYNEHGIVEEMEFVYETGNTAKRQYTFREDGLIAYFDQFRGKESEPLRIFFEYEFWD